MLSILNKSAHVGKILRPILSGRGFISAFNLNASKNPISVQWFSKASANVDIPEAKKMSDEVMSYFPIFESCLKENWMKDEKLKGVSDHFSRLLNHVVAGGKNMRNVMVIDVYRTLASKDQQTPEYLQLAYMLGWCHELVILAIMVADDIIDNGEFRRGLPCWHRLKDVQLIAVNDVWLLENACNVLLKRFFGHLPCYTQLFDQIHELYFEVGIGQCLDWQFSKSSVTSHSLEIYKCITLYKSDPISFHAPFILPMILAGYNDESVFEEIKPISHKISTFFQVYNDFYDFPNETKTGTDIQEGKCTWLSAMAMEYGTDQQKEIMINCYGKSDADSIQQALGVYSEMKMHERFTQYEEEIFKDIKQQIEKSSKFNDLVRKLLIKHTKLQLSRNIHVKSIFPRVESVFSIKRKPQVHNL